MLVSGDHGPLLPRTCYETRPHPNSDILTCMWLTEFTAVRAELIAIERFDQLFFVDDNHSGEESLALLFRCVRRNALLRRLADLVAQN